MRHPIFTAALLFLGVACAPRVDAQTYSAILECNVPQTGKTSLFRISGTDEKPSWQYWLHQEMRWGPNICGISEGTDYTFVNTCRFSPVWYARDIEVTSALKPGVVILRWLPKINRVSGNYEESMRTYSEKQGHIDGPPRQGTCRQGVEPAAPKARF